MRSVRVTPNLRVADLERAKSFYQDFLSLDLEEFNLGWVARYTSSDSGAHVQLVTQEATSSEDAVISVHTPDVDAAYAEALECGYDIVHPLTTEPWGVRRFLVRAPDGNVINIVRHVVEEHGTTPGPHNAPGAGADNGYWHLCVSRCVGQ
ncbi:VOC family protein [Arthrobacter sp.]|uniref:VOC family protein n=1 Tax=Arthrobacter sp. TaxID=1667 RepID=UPI003A958ECB